MKWIKFIAIASTIFFIGRVAWSDGEAAKQLDQIKTNAENSEQNKEAYEKNLKIAEQNVKALDDNLKALATQKLQIIENAKKADENVATMKKQEEQIKGLIKRENDQTEVEKKQIADLEAKIVKLKDNMLKRQNNIAEYNTKLTTIDTEKQQWLDQKSIAEGVQKTIGDKEKQANLDRADWKKKVTGYAAEVAKWKSEADSNRSLYKKYDHLNK